MTTLNSRYPQTNRSRVEVARIYDRRFLENMERAATTEIPEPVVVGPMHRVGKSRRRPFMFSAAIASLTILAVFLGSAEICQACGLINRMQEHSNSMTAPAADTDNIVGIVSP